MKALVDKELMTVKLQELERYLTNLKKHEGVDVERLENDLDQAWIVLHGLQICIQVVLDIGNHLLAEAGLPVKDYADIFPQLARLEIIPEDYAASVKGMAGLRNLLVHEYSELDMDIIVDIINNRLGDFRFFSACVMKYIEKA